MLKPQDVVVALKLACRGRVPPPKHADLAAELHLSASEVHAALKRLAAAQLFNPVDRRIVRANLREFLVHGLRYAFPAQPGPVVRGVPTALSAVALGTKVIAGADDAMVWPSPTGAARGKAIAPLVRSVPDAAAADPALHQLLAVVDVLRVGRARERALAKAELERRLA